ncbi:heavy metal translocating P-type ATPase [Lichenihabitans sp. Uapishka_5]|uniref:heavy metal translocating P-type ATPase n=1 Tax=Lichenihabitans sp. Uapishka_5 TaxID=3037302 RepID=UPI0029E7ED1B|nr:heavy metal translocating P-type ATPase [Lichenihabitans sp. Uapishka_5]MDX7949785.1 heavy metal translocating P-type ATPase [Lichenihabitans sp. Uapishka_5]
MQARPSHLPTRPCCGGNATPSADGPAKVLDPVCGMTVDPAKTPHHAVHAGATFHFCGAGCRTKFMADPGRYLGAARGGSEQPADPGAVYTCPMDPEVEQLGPGSCPKCGMALEPKEIGIATGPNPERADMTRRAWAAAALSVPVVGLAMGQHMADHPLLPASASGLVQLALSGLVVGGAGWPFLKRGWQSVRSGHLNMFTLIALGTGAAWAYSAVATLAPGLFPEGFRDRDGSVGVYFEAAAVIVVLVLIGQVLELRARDSTGDAIRSLLDLTPKTARRIGPGGVEVEVPVAEIMAGDHLRIRPGETVPVDGRILEGSGTLDESMITGEAMPRNRQAGEPVIGGTVNGSGSFALKAEKVGRDTMLAGIVRLVAAAQRSRAPIQRLADVVSGRFVPAVLLVAAIAFVSWAMLGPQPRLAHALIAAVSVLIVACPCALGLATPMSMVVGMGRGARMGVLIRDAAALERFEAVDTLVFDKTGTLTEGRPTVTAIEALDGDADRLLHLAASLEQGSEHPIARALTAAQAAAGLRLDKPSGVTIAAGGGLAGQVAGEEVRVGTEAFVLAIGGVQIDGLEARATALRQQGATVSFVAVGGRMAGLVAVSDPVKASARESLAGLRRDGLRLVMVTGDHQATASQVAAALGIDDVRAGVLPGGKAEIVAALRHAGRVVGMVGDGINDAPALAGADVGIAMGTGTDIAMQSAGITLLGGELAALRQARQLSRATMRNIRQNLAFAFLYNAIGVPVAAGALYPLFGLTLSPMLAAAAMALSSVSVIGNALRLRVVDLG